MAEAGKYVVGVFPETTAFGIEEAGLDGSQQTFRSRDTSVEIRKGATEDASVRLNDAGELREVPTVIWEEGTSGIATNAEGLLTPAGDAVAALSTWTAKLHASLCGEAPTLDTGDTVKTESSPTVKVIEQTTPGNHSAGGFVGHVQSGKLQIRPILSYSVDEMTLAIDLPAPPLADDEIFASAHGKWNEYANTSEGSYPGTAFPIQLERRGNSALENDKAFGVVMSGLSTAEVESGQAPALVWTARCANGEHQGTNTRVAPSGQRPTVLAGGDVLLGTFGFSDDALALKLGRPSLDIARVWEGIEDPNNALGICGWEAMSGSTIGLGLSVLKSQALPSNIAAASWYDLWLQDTDEFLQAFCKFGLSQGRTYVRWYPKLILKLKPVDNPIRNQSAWRLTFMPPEGMTEAPFHWGIF